MDNLDAALNFLRLASDKLDAWYEEAEGDEYGFNAVLDAIKTINDARSDILYALEGSDG